MADRKCPLCDGRGERETVSFSDPSTEILRSCTQCRGTGVLRDVEGELEALQAALDGLHRAVCFRTHESVEEMVACIAQHHKTTCGLASDHHNRVDELEAAIRSCAARKGTACRARSALKVRETEVVTKRFWASFWTKDLEHFEYHGPWWVSGESDQGSSVVAAVCAVDGEAAHRILSDAFDPGFAPGEWRFIMEKAEPDWEPFSSRFPRADWMKWPWPRS